MSTEPLATRRRTSERASRHVHELVARIATGDRSAFRTLYASLAMRVWREVNRSMPLPADSQAVTRSTFIEIWHLARYHVDDGGTDTDAWIAAITARRVEERLRAGAARSDYDHHTYREFAAILGAGGSAKPPPSI